MKVPHDLFKFTTVYENSGHGGSVGANLRAAISLNRAAAATERGGHLDACIFRKASHAPCRCATEHEDVKVGGARLTAVTHAATSSAKAESPLGDRLPYEDGILKKARSFKSNFLV